MARITKGITGGIIGKIATTEGQTRKSQSLIKAPKSKLKDKSRISNQPQNKRFKLINEFLTLFEPSLIIALNYYGLSSEDLKARLLQGAKKTTPSYADNNWKFLRLKSENRIPITPGECAYFGFQNQTRIRFNPGNSWQAESLKGFYKGVSVINSTLIYLPTSISIPVNFYAIRAYSIHPTDHKSALTIAFYADLNGHIQSDVFITAVILPV